MACPACREPLLVLRDGNDMPGHEFYLSGTVCAFCGWCVASYGFETEEDQGYWGGRTILTEESERAQIAFSNLLSEIELEPDKVRDMSPRRFEKFIADCFRAMGFEVELTPATKDGGFDLLVMRTETESAIVEVKRKAGPVGVELVRQLRGVQFREDVGRAVLVTSSRFTHGARKESSARMASAPNYVLDLMTLSDVFRALDLWVDDSRGVAELRRSRIEYRTWLKDQFSIDARSQAVAIRHIFAGTSVRLENRPGVVVEEKMGGRMALVQFEDGKRRYVPIGQLNLD